MNKSKAFSILLMSMLVASALSIGLPPAKANPTNIEIVPNTLTFGPAPAVGTHFTIACWIYGVTDLYGVDIQIGWNTAWIQYVSHVKTIPRGTTFPDGILFSPTIGVKDQVDETASMAGSAPGTMYWLAEASMVPAAPFAGDGTAFTMEFVVVAQPSPGEPDAVVNIAFTAVTLANSLGNPILDVVQVPGVVTIKAPEHIYPPEPVLVVDPAVTHGVFGDPFSVDVLLMGAGATDLSPEWDVAGLDVVMTFDPTLISADSIVVDPTGWFASFWPNGIFVVLTNIDNIAGTAQFVFLGIPGDGGVHTEVSGQGIIATITFTAIFEQIPPPFTPPTCALALGPTTIAGFPHPERPYAPWSGSATSVPIPHSVINGLYIAPMKLLGRVIDVWTQFGGQGLYQPSDMLWPQKGFNVTSKVTYNDWPEQNKDVAFQLIDPSGNTWGIFYARTNTTGYATTFIRFPWPCDNPESLFGVWKLVATVDIACTVVNDTMEFKYNYHVVVWKTTLDLGSYDHTVNNVITVTIDYGSQSMATFPVIFTATAVDETGVPFGFAMANVTVGGAVWCTYNNGTVTLTIPIPKFARAGIGHVYIGVLSALPINGGDALYPMRYVETIVDFTILAS